MTDYTDLDTVKAAVGKTLTGHDDNITRVITAMSRAIDRFCHRPDGFVASGTATARLFAGRGESYLLIDECAAITTVAVKASSSDTTYTAWDSDEWVAFSGDANNPDYNHTPYTAIMAAWGSGKIFTSGYLDDDDIVWSGRGRGLSGRRARRAAPPTVQITAKWGYALTIPPQIEEACITETARLVKQAESNYAESMVSEALGRLIQVAKLHPSTELMLVKGRFVRRAVG